MRMLRHSRILGASDRAIFEALAAVDRTPEWARSVEAVELLDPLPVRVGTRFLETRSHGGGAGDGEMTVAELTPHERIELHSEPPGLRVVSRWTITPVDVPEPPVVGPTSAARSRAFTQVEFELEIVADRWRARLWMRIVSIVMRGFMRRCLDDDLDDLERHLSAPDDSA